MILGMHTPATSNSSGTEVVTSVSSRPLGQPSGYSEETVGRLCVVIRRRVLSDGEAARGLGIPRQTLSRLKQEHPEPEEWLAIARKQLPEAMLAFVNEAKTADGRRIGGRRRGRWPKRRPTLADVGALIEENEALRAQLRGEWRKLVERDSKPQRLKT
jgi:hypothetical protein